MFTQLFSQFKDPLDALSNSVENLQLKDCQRFQYALNDPRLINDSKLPYSHYIQWDPYKGASQIINVKRERFALEGQQTFQIELWRDQKLSYQRTVVLGQEQSREVCANLAALVLEINSFSFKNFIETLRPIELVEMAKEYNISNEQRAQEWLRVSLEVLKNALGEFQRPTEQAQEDLLLQTQLSFERQSTGDIQLSLSLLSLELLLQCQQKTQSPPAPLKLQVFNRGKQQGQNKGLQGPDLDAYFATSAPYILELLTQTLDEVMKKAAPAAISRS